MSHYTPYLTFSREEWKALRANAPLTLDNAALEKKRGILDTISLQEVADFYLPLSRLLNLLYAQSQDIYKSTSFFLGNYNPKKVPFIIGISGSVAVGKSTVARVLQGLLQRWPDEPHVELVTTDGFLFPNHVLEEKGLMHRKGFPESYDRHRLIDFLSDLKLGRSIMKVPLYDHLVYDILPEEKKILEQPDIVIVEGLNILQSLKLGRKEKAALFVSDFLDFTIYVDADTQDIAHWYIERFKVLCKTAFRNPDSYFRRYAQLSDREAEVTARQIWSSINEPNLVENILPTKTRARLILEKGSDHSIQQVRLRKL